MASEFRIGIIGAGMITLDAHLPACLASTQVAVTALVDANIERARKAAADYGVKALISANVDDVLSSIDGAIIATPNASHCDLALRCMDKGIDVLIEKPLAVTVDEGKRIVAAARSSGRIAAVGYSTRFRENIRLLSRLLESAYFGRVSRFVHQFGTPGGWAPFSAYNLSRGAAGGGVLVVTASHFIDRMLHFWGMPEGVRYVDDSLGGPEANCVAEFEWLEGKHGGLAGCGRYSKTVRLPSGLVVETEAGIVKLDDADDAEIVLRPHRDPHIETVIRNRARERYARARKSVSQLQIDDFVDACRNRRKPLVDAEEGLSSLQLFDRLYAARSDSFTTGDGTTKNTNGAAIAPEPTNV